MVEGAYARTVVFDPLPASWWYAASGKHGVVEEGTYMPHNSEAVMKKLVADLNVQAGQEAFQYVKAGENNPFRIAYEGKDDGAEKYGKKAMSIVKSLDEAGWLESPTLLLPA